MSRSLACIETRLPHYWHSLAANQYVGIAYRKLARSLQMRFESLLHRRKFFAYAYIMGNFGTYQVPSDWVVQHYHISISH